ncbi:MAG: hypothetical protein JXR10_05920 [Cyclobacteriaceae bacterium]
MRQKVDFEWIKQELFSDEEKKIVLRSGETLLYPNQENRRLFLVGKGKVLGYLNDAELENYPIFEETENKFIGVYSYFSEDHKSYSRVVAGEDTIIYYYDRPYSAHSQDELNELAPFFMELVVNELFSRQHFAKRMAKEKHLDTQRLLKAEKLATLGQMAAGLAHELNNSIGVLNGSMNSLEEFITSCTAGHSNSMLSNYFRVGLTKGQWVSSKEARDKRQIIESQLKKISPSQARRLAKTGIEITELKKIYQTNPALLDEVLEFWDAGCAIHDMQIAAKHATHVVKSVKQLGVAKQEWSDRVNVNHTINEALVILTNLTKHVETTIDLEEGLPNTAACAGQLVQVWINLIKNGIESMLQNGTEKPHLRVQTYKESDFINVSIVDNGPGIPKKILTKIFEPSFTTKVSGLNFGLGLGLSIVQRIVLEHDAQINVSSEPGHTEFSVKIPLTD